MKNISYLLLVSILFFSNCSNDNGVEEMLTETITNITEADLVGDWEFVSLEFEGKTYTDCDNNDLLGEYNLLKISFFNVTLKSELYNEPSLMYYNSNCDNSILSERRFNIKDNYIYLYNETNYKFLILNSQSFNGKLLKLKLITDSKSIPADGIYTLKKRL